MSDISMDGLQPGAVPVNADPKKSPAYRLLLGVVIFLGVLIVVGLGALIGGLIARAGTPGQAMQTDLPITYNLAPGAQIVAMQVEGNRLILQVRSNDGDEADILDLQSGRLIGQVKTAPHS